MRSISEAFAEEKCPDTFPLFAKIDVNGENEALQASKSTQKASHIIEIIDIYMLI